MKKQETLYPTRPRVATYLNTEICLTNWQIGKRIKEDILYNQRAEYGKLVVKGLAERLTERYGKGWSYYKLQHCVRAVYTFSEEEIGYAARTLLTWTHLRSLMGIKDDLARSFYRKPPTSKIEPCKERFLPEIVLYKEHF